MFGLPVRDRSSDSGLSQAVLYASIFSDRLQDTTIAATLKGEELCLPDAETATSVLAITAAIAGHPCRKVALFPMFHELPTPEIGLAETHPCGNLL